MSTEVRARLVANSQRAALRALQELTRWLDGQPHSGPGTPVRSEGTFRTSSTLSVLHPCVWRKNVLSGTTSPEEKKGRLPDLSLGELPEAVPAVVDCMNCFCTQASLIYPAP